MAETRKKPARSEDQDASRDRVPSGRRLGRWQRILLAASIALMAAGLGLQGYRMLGPDAAPAPAGEPAGGLSVPFAAATDGSAPGAGDGTTEPARTLLDDAAPGVFRLGFSFFAGFAVAYAARRFIGLTILVCGAALLLLFGLQYAGVIDVDWAAMEGHFDRVAGWLGEQTASFRSFVTGYLPSSASAGLGLVVGFRKK